MTLSKPLAITIIAIALLLIFAWYFVQPARYVTP